MSEAQYAGDLIKTTVMLSSGSFILTCNLMSKDHQSCSVKGAVIFFFISIVLCLIALMQITGLAKKNEVEQITILDNKPLQHFVLASIFSFGAGCFILLVGILSH